jgi:hypothetical protein
MNNTSNDNTKENIDDIRDVIFDYTGNGDDELTLRLIRRNFYSKIYNSFLKTW